MTNMGACENYRGSISTLREEFEQKAAKITKSKNSYYRRRRK